MTRFLKPRQTGAPARFGRFLLPAIAILLVAAGTSKASFVVGFTNGNITAKSTAPGSAFQVTVFGKADAGFSNLTNSQVVFAVSVKSSAAAGVDIDQVYFQDGTLLDLAQVNYNDTSVSPNTVTFKESTKPANLPDGNSLTPVAFVATKEFDSSATKPGDAANSTTILPGETEGLLFDLKSGQTFADVVSALTEGINDPSAVWNTDGSDKTGTNVPLGLRIGLHVQNASGSNTQSASFVDTSGFTPGGGVTSPEPSSAILLGLSSLGLAGFAGLRRRLKAKAAA